jgi:hypothetical protein
VVIDNEGFDDNKGEGSETLHGVICGVWLSIIIKFESQYFLNVSISGTVLESPRKSHEKCQSIIFVLSNKSKSQERHYDNNNQDDNTSNLASKSINNPSNEERPKNLTKTKCDHCEHRQFIGCVIIDGGAWALESISYHSSQVARVVSYTYPSPSYLWQ